MNKLHKNNIFSDEIIKCINLHADSKHPIMEIVICILQLGRSDVKCTLMVSSVEPNGILMISSGLLF